VPRRRPSASVGNVFPPRRVPPPVSARVMGRRSFEPSTFGHLLKGDHDERSAGGSSANPERKPTKPNRMAHVHVVEARRFCSQPGGPAELTHSGVRWSLAVGMSQHRGVGRCVQASAATKLRSVPLSARKALVAARNSSGEALPLGGALRRSVAIQRIGRPIGRGAGGA